MEAGKHSFSGSCANTSRTFNHNETFSYGIFEWVPRDSGIGVKKSAVKVRVSGPVDMADAVKAMAEEVVALLDAGEYKGAKNVKVKG